VLRSMRQTIAKTQHIAESRTGCGCQSALNPDLHRQATLETRCLAPSLVFYRRQALPRRNPPHDEAWSPEPNANS
jgi:hypothetical protein